MLNSEVVKDKIETGNDAGAQSEKPRCPFVYANGCRCCGEVSDVRFYGKLHQGYPGVRKVRLWCSEKDDHAGAVSDFISKERMEFYPEHIPADLKDFVWGQFDNEHGGCDQRSTVRIASRF